MTDAEQRLAAALAVQPAPATFWWRDDDAGRDHPRLRRLLELAAGRGAALALAVVPAWLDGEAGRAIAGCAEAVVLQHGIAHADHALPGGKKIELGGSAALGRLEDGLRHGSRRLRETFGSRFLPVLTPPWNRIDGALTPRLPALGFTGLSRFGPRAAEAAAPGLREVNTHVDLILWREGRRPMTPDELAGAVAAALRRASGEPIGLLSHHLVMDEPAFLALDRVLALLQDHPQARLASARALFGGEG